MGFEVEPFSVKHEYETPWDKNNPVLNTCNPGRMIAVSHSLPPQPVQEGVEVIFTYDVKYTVSPSVPKQHMAVLAQVAGMEGCSQAQGNRNMQGMVQLAIHQMLQ